MLLSSPPNDVAPPWDRVRRASNRVRLASFESSFAVRPGPAREAVEVVAENFTVGGGFEAQTAVFSAYGFEPWSYSNYVFNGVRPPFDLALYKQREGTGSHVYYESFEVGDVTITFGTASIDYGLVSGTWTQVQTPPLPDTATPEIGSPYDLLFEPRFGGDFGGGGGDIPWRATTSTLAERAPTPPFTGPAWTATIELSDPCTWSDVETAAARVLTEGYGSEISAINTAPPASNTGAGETDGTRYMAKMRSRYRVPAAPHARRATWREVTRRNNAGSDGGFSSAFTITLARRALTEPIARPYLDEWGAWSPSDLRWADAGERLLRWAAGHSTSPNLVLYGQTAGDGEAGYDRRVIGTRFRVLLDTAEAGLVARVTLNSPGATEVLDLPVEDGATVVQERIASLAPTANITGGHYLAISSIVVLRDGVPVPFAEVPYNIAFRQRRSLRISGHAALDGSDSYLTPARYRVQTTTIEWGLDATATNGSEYDAGQRYQVPATGSARLVGLRAYHATTGAPLWTDTDTFGVITERTGSFAGITWLPAGYSEGVLFPPTTSTATVLERVQSLPTTAQLRVPLDADTPTRLGEVLAVVERAEDVAAGEPGIWRDLDCAVRGAAVFLEGALIVTLATPPGSP